MKFEEQESIEESSKEVIVESEEQESIEESRSYS